MGREIVGLLKIDDVINDPSLADGLTKDCSGCDPYTPYHQQRENCTVCGGTGQEPLAITQIAKEIADSKSEAASGGNKKRGKAAALSLVD